MEMGFENAEYKILNPRIDNMMGMVSWEYEMKSKEEFKKFLIL